MRSTRLPLAAAALLALPAAVPGGEAAAPPPRVFLVGAPREGPVAALAAALREEGLAVAERDDLPEPLPWTVEVILLGRPPRDGGEAERWRRALEGFLRAGGRAAAAPGAASAPLAAAVPGEELLGSAVGVPDAAAVPAAAAMLAATRVAAPHPADRPEPGVAPDLHRLAPPGAPDALPPRTLAYLALVAAALAAAAVLGRRRGLGPLRSLALLAGVAAAGSGLLFLPGVLGDPVRVDRFVLLERAAPGAPSARRVVLVRAERIRGAGEARLVLEGDAAWEEVLYEAGGGSGARFGEGEATVSLPAPGTRALLAGVAGVEAPEAPGPLLARVRVLRGLAWRLPPEGPPGEASGPGRPLRGVLDEIRREGDPRLGLAAELVRALLRPPPGVGPLRIDFPVEGPLAEVVHLER